MDILAALPTEVSLARDPKEEIREVARLLLLKYSVGEISIKLNKSLDDIESLATKAANAGLLNKKEELLKLTNDRFLYLRIRVAEKALSVVEKSLNSFTDDVILAKPVKAMKAALSALDRTEFIGNIKNVGDNDTKNSNNFFFSLDLLKEAKKTSKRVLDAEVMK